MANRKQRRAKSRNQQRVTPQQLIKQALDRGPIELNSPEIDGDTNYADWSPAEVKAEAQSRGLDISGLTKKSQVVALLVEDDEEEEEILLYTLNGVTYSTPPPAYNLGVQYLFRIRNEGPELAALWLLGELVGDQAVFELMNFKGLKKEHFEAVIQRVEAIVLGGQEDVGKESSSTSAPSSGM